jgi:hypothetical protein
MTDEERLHRGSRAREVLENEEFTRAFDAIEEELTNAWKQSPQRDSTGREHLFLALTMLSKVKASLTTTMETGQLALAELQHQKSMAEKAKAYLGMS